MDDTKNRIPDSVKTVHMIGICGTAMGALACMLKEAGIQVTGSDHNIYPPMSDFLVEKGICIGGFSEKNITASIDLVIVGNTIHKDNPEVLAMVEVGCFYCSLPQALNHFFARGKNTILVSGTHGKTTTSSLLAWVLYDAGLDPSFMIGGIVRDFNSNYRLGSGEVMVIEGDEYDTAFFDKGAKFYHFSPMMTILTSIEFDHADIFRDLEHVLEVFDRFLSQHKKDRFLLAADCDCRIDSILPGKPLRINRYGFNENSDWKVVLSRIEDATTFFDVFKHGEFFGHFSTPLPGRHNLMNILSVIAAADNLHIPVAKIQRAVASFKGVKRRQEIRGICNGVRVMDDFAHHPTAVLETTRAVKSIYPDNRLIAVFEPRTNSSRRAVFQDVYPKAFDAADIILIREAPLLEKIPELERFSSRNLVQDLQDRQKKAFFFETTQDIVSWCSKNAKRGDTILVMSNGGFDAIHEKLLAAL